MKHGTALRLLALETSSAHGSIALAVGDEVRERTIATPREQIEQVLPHVDALLSEAGIGVGSLDAVVFGRGPGSFTGVRIAAAVAQGLALAAERPLVTVSSLASMAQRAWREQAIERALVCVDARMGEVYAAEFGIVEGVAECVAGEFLKRPLDVQAPAAMGWSALGDGFAAHPETLGALAERADAVLGTLVPMARDLLPRARAELAAGRTLSAAGAQPTYLRGANAWKKL